MNNREFAYLLYNMNIGESFGNNKISGVRVPGGWVINNAFVPYNEEHFNFAMEPTEEIIEIKCPDCEETHKYNKNYDFQGHEYICDNPECAIVIEYESK